MSLLYKFINFPCANKKKCHLLSALTEDDEGVTELNDVPLPRLTALMIFTDARSYHATFVRLRRACC